jgi:hypothetical protein
MKVTVTQEDIDKGTRMSVTACAVARAIKRDPNVRRVIASQGGIRVWEKSGVLGLSSKEVRYQPSRDVACWISRFDSGPNPFREAVKPVVITLNSNHAALSPA